MAVKKITLKAKKLPARRRDVPASNGFVSEVRDELKAEIRSVDRRVDSLMSRFDAMDARFDAMDAKFEGRFSEMDSKFEQMDAKFAARAHAQDAKIDQILAVVHRVQAIVEESRSENRVALEALNGFVQRMDRLENRQDQVDETVRGLLRATQR